MPTDNEYLDELSKLLKDDGWAEMQERATKRVDPVAAARRAISEGTFQHDQLDALIEAIRESTTPSLYFRGKFIDLLRNIALVMLKPYRQQLESVPVGCLPTRTLNGGAYRTPRGGAVILLDSGVILQLGMLVRSYFAFYSWYAPEPYCRDHPRSEFGRTIQHLAAFCVSGDLDQLRKISTWHCPSLPVYDQLVEMFAMGIEIFIMLHEYGHIALNHLAACG